MELSQHREGERGRGVPRLGVYRRSPAAASSSSVAGSSFHFSSATFSRRASSFLMYSSSSWRWGGRTCERLGRCEPCSPAQPSLASRVNSERLRIRRFCQRGGSLRQILPPQPPALFHPFFPQQPSPVLPRRLIRGAMVPFLASGPSSLMPVSKPRGDKKIPSFQPSSPPLGPPGGWVMASHLLLLLELLLFLLEHTQG